jgi:hypothetical protein
MTKKRLIILAIILSSFLFLKPAFNDLSDYLSKSIQVKANILVVEGWIPDYAVDLAYDKFQKEGYEYIVTTGLKYTPDYFKLYRDGYLIFYPGKMLKKPEKSENHKIDIYAAGSLYGENAAHFNFYVNKSLIADFNVEKKKSIKTVQWVGNLKDIDSLMVEFTNDKEGDFGDRNLYIKKIVIDDQIIIPFQNNSAYDIGSLDGKKRIINNSNSYADVTRNKLFVLGIDSSLIISIPCEKVRINRTLTSALAFREWLSKTNIRVKGINIISVGTHSRRTWLTYYKLLDKKYEIGITALPDGKRNLYRIFSTIRETLGIIYYWIILIPYSGQHL